AYARIGETGVLALPGQPAVGRDEDADVRADEDALGAGRGRVDRDGVDRNVRQRRARGAVDRIPGEAAVHALVDVRATERRDHGDYGERVEVRRGLRRIEREPCNVAGTARYGEGRERRR